mgnify:CR=1 FL=1
MLTDMQAWEKLKSIGIEQWIQEKKQQGKIRQVGFSYHGNTENFCRILDAYDWDFCQIQYNYMDEHTQAGLKGLRYAHEKGIPVIIMEPLRGGKLVKNLPKEAEEIFRVADAANYGNSGVEGISWYKDGMLLVGAQTDARLWAYKLDGTIVWSKSLKTVAIGCLEIADICYDPVKDQIWIIDSETQSIYLFNGDATKHLATYKVNFAGNSESVYLDYTNRECMM